MAGVVIVYFNVCHSSERQSASFIISTLGSVRYENNRMNHPTTREREFYLNESAAMLER